MSCARHCGFTRRTASLPRRFERPASLAPQLIERSDVVTIGQDGFVLEIQVKPAAPRSDLVWGLGEFVDIGTPETLSRIGVVR